MTTLTRLQIASNVADLLNHAGKTPSEALELVGYGGGEVFSEDSSAIGLDDPENDMVDFGWEGDELITVVRVPPITGRWRVDLTVRDPHVPPWTYHPWNGDSDAWGDEQDRSEWFEAEAENLAARVALAVSRCDEYISAGSKARPPSQRVRAMTEVAADIQRILKGE
jgi:hypothetical protein